VGAIPGPAAHGDVHARVAEAFRLEYARVVASVLRVVRDIDAAEEVVQEAFAQALDHWPATGLPDRPGAWLLTAARRRALDRLRHTRRVEGHADAIAYEATLGADDEAPDVTDPETIPDDRLRLIFTCCHPGLPAESRVALTLRLVGGLSTAEIARAFLAPEPTIAQRLVRAKRTIRDRALPWARPRLDLHQNHVVVVGERGDRRLVPLRFLPHRPLGIASLVVEERGVQDQIARHPRDAGLLQPLGPAVEDVVEVVVVEAARDIGIAAADDEERAEELTLANVALPHGSVVVGSRFARFNAAGLNAAGLIVVPTNGARNAICRPLLQAGDVIALKSPIGPGRGARPGGHAANDSLWRIVPSAAKSSPSNPPAKASRSLG